MNRDPLTAHIFTIPCDSHGLQLLVKDIVSSEPIKSLISKAQLVVNKLRSSPKQLSLLREKSYTTRRTLIVAAITRWGTQLQMIDSVLGNESQLSLYALDPMAEMKEVLSNWGANWNFLFD
ncbi:hypothetical protein E4U14_002477 [Claviceps sp. LM454 group G7]|nr:hypothetical protein E4U14_002477 [Claviceps sp. LM454 group G7]